MRYFLISLMLFLLGLGSSIWKLGVSEVGSKAPVNTMETQETVAFTTFEIDKQFVVPIIKNGSSVALVVLAIGIELPETELEKVQNIEPKIRDMFLSSLLALGNRGVFDNNFTSASAQAAVKTALLDRSKSLVHSSIRNIFILSIARQDLT